MGISRIVISNLLTAKKAVLNDGAHASKDEEHNRNGDVRNGAATPGHVCDDISQKGHDTQKAQRTRLSAEEIVYMYASAWPRLLCAATAMTCQYYFLL
jgi:hypothetical protein